MMNRPAGWETWRLRTDLLKLGLPLSSNLLVHCSMRQVGPVAGGPAGLLAAIQGAAGAGATVVVPAQTSNNSTSSKAFRDATRGLDARALADYEAGIEGFDRAETPSFGMGALAEYIRQNPDAARSNHPQTSFCALGPDAAAVTAVHDLSCHLGERSPLGALYTADAHILLIGVGFEVCTAFHLAEYHLPHPPTRGYRCYVLDRGRRVPLDFEAVDLHDDDFGKLGDVFKEQSVVRTGLVGNAVCWAAPLRAAVDFAVTWMLENRRPNPPR